MYAFLPTLLARGEAKPTSTRTSYINIGAGDSTPPPPPDYTITNNNTTSAGKPNAVALGLLVGLIVFFALLCTWCCKRRLGQRRQTQTQAANPAVVPGFAVPQYAGVGYPQPVVQVPVSLAAPGPQGGGGGGYYYNGPGMYPQLPPMNGATDPSTCDVVGAGAGAGAGGYVLPVPVPRQMDSIPEVYAGHGATGTTVYGYGYEQSQKQYEAPAPGLSAVSSPRLSPRMYSPSQIGIAHSNSFVGQNSKGTVRRERLSLGSRFPIAPPS